MTARRQSCKAFARHATRLCAPPSPLAAYRAHEASLRTGFTHLYARRERLDRSPAAAFRSQCRDGGHTSQTSGCVPGFVQANFVALPRAHAFDFLKFCLHNPRACPLLDVTAPGSPSPTIVAPGADLRTDIPKYCIWRDGEVAGEASDVVDLWDDSMVGFLLGCSFSWESILQREGLPPRQVEQGVNVPMFQTSLRNASVGPFAGNLVVSMRPYLPSQLGRVEAITSAYPGAHGGPVHWGDPTELGLTFSQLTRPCWGDPVEIRPGEVPVFWACGVTPQTALREARLPLAITHAPGHMFICDLQDSELKV
ncbi:hypothetical protein AB1Y20_014983 [Prymnesium parvum]|uniref:Hydro-lyase n=1 Tax=Prymnesium parvum TaxID=97485 RepID=A0AB34JX25_PRYPA